MIASATYRKFLGEYIGTFLLVFFGCGSVCAAVLTGAQVGVFQVAIVWGIGIALAIHLTAGMSGAHLNPAVTLGLTLAGSFRPRDIPLYVFAQSLGAFTASCTLYLIFQEALVTFEAAHNITRGLPGSEASAMVFAEFFPNPGGKPLASNPAMISLFGAFITEMIGTAILMFVILGLTDERNASRPRELAPILIGLTVTCLISLLAPLTMAGFNPARDFVPRLFTVIVGWGWTAFSANGSGWFTVYILGPCLGASLSGFLYTRFVGVAYRTGG